MMTPEQQNLRQQIRRDVLVDTLGNTTLAFGLWGWWAEPSLHWMQWLHQPTVFIPLTATGILNLVYLPARLKRLREWRGS